MVPYLKACQFISYKKDGCDFIKSVDESTRFGLILVSVTDGDELRTSFTIKLIMHFSHNNLFPNIFNMNNLRMIACSGYLYLHLPKKVLSFHCRKYDQCDHIAMHSSGWEAQFPTHKVLFSLNLRFHLTCTKARMPLCPKFVSYHPDFLTSQATHFGPISLLLFSSLCLCLKNEYPLGIGVNCNLVCKTDHTTTLMHTASWTSPDSNI